MKFGRQSAIITTLLLLHGCGGNEDSTVATVTPPATSTGTTATPASGSTSAAPAPSPIAATPTPVASPAPTTTTSPTPAPTPVTTPVPAPPPISNPPVSGSWVSNTSPELAGLPAGFSGRSLAQLPNGSTVLFGSNANFLQTNSSDLSSWSSTIQSSPSLIGSRTALWTSAGMFVLRNGGISISTDGSNWVEYLRENFAAWPSSLWDIVIAPNGTAVITGAAYGETNAPVLVSNDLKNWTPVLQPQMRNADWVSVAYGNGRFVSVSNTNASATSTDGTTWSFHQDRSTTAFQQISFLGGSNQFVAAANARPDGVGGFIGNVYTSSDGVTWQLRNIGLAANVIRIQCDNTICIGSVSGNQPALIWSTDLINWQSFNYGRTSLVTEIQKIGTRWVAVGNDGLLLTSPNGTNWTQITSR